MLCIYFLLYCACKLPVESHPVNVWSVDEASNASSVTLTDILTINDQMEKTLTKSTKAKPIAVVCR